jgi:hypothetical protein
MQKEGWYGVRCEFRKPCSALEIDTQTDGFLGAREWSDNYNLLFANDGTIANVYGRPVYISDAETFEILLFTGRRWVLTFSTLLNFSNRSTLADYLTSDFHAHWSNFAVAFLSEPVDIDTPSGEYLLKVQASNEIVM